MSAKIVRCWIFTSSSDPDKTYETLEYSDRKLSCSCPGWTRRCALDGTRSCRHVRLVHMGLADKEAERCLDYTEAASAFLQPPTTTTKVKHGKKNKTTGPGFGEFGGRAIIK